MSGTRRFRNPQTVIRQQPDPQVVRLANGSRIVRDAVIGCVSDDAPDWVLHLRIREVDGQAVVAALDLSVPDGEDALSAVPSIDFDAVRDAALRHLISLVEIVHMASEYTGITDVVARVATSVGAHGMTPTPDEVAAVYREACNTVGRKQPTKAVAAAFNVSHSTAAKWVYDARHKHNVLPKTDKGRAAS